MTLANRVARRYRENLASGLKESGGFFDARPTTDLEFERSVKACMSLTHNIEGEVEYIKKNFPAVYATLKARGYEAEAEEGREFYLSIVDSCDAFLTYLKPYQRAPKPKR